MRRPVLILCHLAFLVLAFRSSDSAGGFLVTGVGSSLLLDRYATRLLPWRAPARRAKAWCLLVLCLLGATLVVYLLRPGLVPWWEAGYCGVLLTLAAFLVRVPVLLAGRPRTAWGRALFAGGLVVGVALLYPVLIALHPLHTVPRRTPDALGLAFEEVSFRTEDGLALAGWLVPCRDARGNVLFCHGHGRNRGHVAGLLPTLHGLRLNVLAFDFRGHGESAGHTSTFGQREVRDLLAAAAYLCGRCPGKPLFLIGFSLGAAVALQGLPHLGEVRGVWSEGSFSRFTTVADAQFDRLPRRVRKPLLRWYQWLGWLDCGLRGSSLNPIDALRGLAVPIHFCHARADGLVPLREGQELYAAYAGPKWHWWVEGARHYDVRQRNREEYLRRLRNFLEAQLARE